ncbi:hypothetical protein DUNSADRAFT_7660 [Dunaliella salina]|uniref:Lysine-specific metallo-endopeptidase domain-containing protein n=1 Tax=Dunaliella salina TaxID=3046 RepID=A0ABQ7H657_DUNSA|nr:hypothetical protein DUNSADRAFT_7660 [Dunaliella salina]|eukprot:KAF5842346.1 hypothetical protein DUNSADRAFT_7660 [Dunaliella salina]
MLGEFTAGPGDAVFEVHSKEPARCSISPLRLDLLQPKPEWGMWRQRAKATPGIPVMAFDCVCEQAVNIACHIVERMLEDVQPEVLARLVGCGTRVGIIGRDQVTSDVPEHNYLKLSRGGRNIDTTTRGLGGSIGCPLTTCGEENLIMVDDRSYPEESILVHEFGHTVMNVGLDDISRAAIQEAYQKAKASGIYLNSGCYAMENADEYWAEGTQAWFEATTRTGSQMGGLNGAAYTTSPLHRPNAASVGNPAFQTPAAALQADGKGKMALDTEP